MRRLALSISMLALGGCLLPAESDEEAQLEPPGQGPPCGGDGVCLDTDYDGLGTAEIETRLPVEPDAQAESQTPDVHDTPGPDADGPSVSTKAPSWMEDVWHERHSWWMCEYDCEGWLFAGFACAASETHATEGCPMPAVDAMCTLDVLVDTQKPCTPGLQVPGF